MELMDEEMPTSANEPDIDPDSVVQKWLDKFQDNTLSTLHFKEHWRMCVPRIYSPSKNDTCLSWCFNEDLGQKLLFNTMEQFICNGDPNMVLTQLSDMDKAPSVCGRVFKMGEPTYSCRECGMDNTCVLCVECFKNSEHRYHKYKMGTSSGGGCCDCGDIEAWKKSPFCEIHSLGLTKPEPTSGETRTIPNDLKERTRIVFDSILWYCYHLLSTEQISDLRLGDITDNFFNNDLYCTILYNDEIHTFEQVIGTLTRVKLCNQKTAIEFVTNIDREGRAIVKCSTFHNCNELKKEIEKHTSRHGNKPLKVIVSHAYVIAHQIYAIKLLKWLESFLGNGECFREIFTKVAIQPQFSYPSIIKGILLRDSTLWKMARSQWQRLLISGMLLEYENKKELAKIFTKNYGAVMKDFIKDDHDHSYSISSLSVQLFTVPTLAHYLIANDDVLFILLNTFMSECLIKCNKNGKLEFERSPSSHTFKRAQYMLYDLRYLLSSVPEQWTDDLRRNFLHGLSVLLNLLTKMQGMDSVVRQIGQHMEYEPEWESAFNLHIKLAYCISLMIKWCSTDKVVLIKSYRSVLKKLDENPIDLQPELYEVNELVDHSCSSIVYDVSLKAVSIHLPLTRFLAGLHLNLEKFGLNFDSLELQIQKPTPVQILEPVLRCQVMIAQVHAGMWRRNGYALLNQLYYYHNVKCRTEMLDRDIILLQICASLIESNEFLIHLLYKFNLINWASQEFELNNSANKFEDDSTRQIVCLVEEFLQLLIVIIGERFIPGITNVTIEDRIKKEIIQYLCIKPLPHSELNKIVPDDVGNETTLDDVIDELATFKKPTNQTKGVYELKPEFFNEYNVFFYHYTREELSKSEEAQRKRRKLQNELECCPPPKLLKLNESFGMLVNLLQCDVMLHLIQLILERCNNLLAKSFSELQLHKCLHLIGYALLEEEAKNYPFFKFIQNSRKFNIYQLMNQLLDCPRVDAHKDLLKWTIQKYRDLDEQTDEISDNPTNEQKNDVVVVDNEKERRAKLAAERRAKLMAQMTAMQKNFMKENATLFDTIEDIKQKSDSVMDLTETSEQQIALGPNRTQRMNCDKSYTCILCQEESTINGPSTLVLAGFVQQATVLCQYKNDLDLSKHDPLYLNSNLGPAPYTSTCGHVMHSECWRKHFDNVMLREHRRPYRSRHPASFDVDKQEFLCPLCECLSNTVLPLVPALNAFIIEQEKVVLNFDDWLRGVEDILHNKIEVCHGVFKCPQTCKNIHCLACLNSSSDNMDSDLVCDANCILQPHQIFQSCDLNSVSNEEFKKLFPHNSPDLAGNLKESIQLFAQVTYTRGLNLTPHPSDKRLAPMVWKSLSYTIHAIEVLLRDSNKALLGNLSCRQRDCIETLTRLVGVLGSTWQTSVVIHNYALNLLTILFEHTNDGPSILQWDSLGFLIPLTFALPSLASKDQPTPIPIGGVLELYELRTIFLSHVARILILLDLNPYQNCMEYESENANLLKVYSFLNINTDNLNCDLIWQHVQNASLPFLRCCCLFYHYLTDVPAPSKLQEVNGDTFENMCTYLDLPQTSAELFQSEIAMDLVKRWCQHDDVLIYLGATNRNEMQMCREPLPINHLIDLPPDYSELINTVSTFTCPNNDEVSRNPTMCLVCGEILCSQAYCCQTELHKTNVGACNYHAYKCGAGVGIFLRVRECEILFLATPHRGCFVSPPYIDDYGETDQGLRRGNPLKLCPERYRKLQTLWLSHSIHEEIARDIEASSHIVTTQWNHL